MSNILTALKTDEKIIEFIILNKKNWKLEKLEIFEIISRCIRRYKNWFLPAWMVSAIAGYLLYIQLI